MNTLSHILAGLMFGYAIASCMESYLHRAIHRAGPFPRNKISCQSQSIDVLTDRYEPATRSPCETGVTSHSLEYDTRAWSGRYSDGGKNDTRNNVLGQAETL